MQGSGYPTKQVARMTGLTVRQLDYWAVKDYFVPSAKRGKGSGTRRCYTLDDMTQLFLIKRLLDHGWSIQAIWKARATIRAIVQDPDLKVVLFNGKGMLLGLYNSPEGDPILLDARRSGGQQVMKIMLDALREDAERSASTVADNVAHG